MHGFVSFVHSYALLYVIMYMVMQGYNWLCMVMMGPWTIVHGPNRKFEYEREQNFQNQRGPPTKLDVHAFHIIYLHIFFEPILFLTPWTTIVHSLKGKFCLFEGKQKR